ncbi:MAG: MFS transporter [Chloroflexi bacterium]|nr:MFS transporter [Chloroflexota bacterium]
MISKRYDTNYRWYILGLAALTNAFVAAMPTICLTVLFKEIASELNLDLVQVGLIWGIGALPSVLALLAWGALGDRLGPKRILTIGCVLIGALGALRGAAFDFNSLLAAVLAFGFVAPLVAMNSIKACGIWFPSRQLGLANGVLSMGMALGFMLASMISATILSPWLGGWRNVLFLYGALAFAFSVPWFFTRSVPASSPVSVGKPGTIPIWQALQHVARIRKVWLLGLIMLGIGGCIQGTLGYLPLYLRELGWLANSADSAASTFHAASMLFVVPIALWSDRMGSRRKVLLAAALAITVGVGSLSVADGFAVWIAVALVGMVRDGFMGVFITLIIETEGIGATYAGTATGLVMAFAGVGHLVAPPLGNSLASIAPGMPFVAWAILAVVGTLGLVAFQERNANVVGERVIVQPNPVRE